jgi:segregation and condensation protein A
MATPTVFNLELDQEHFAGPFDLLLALVLRDAVPLSDVAVAGVCLAYLERLGEESELDLETASEFLILVAALCELKSRDLLPGEETEDDELSAEEAADELAARLAEYARVRAATEWLAERRRELGCRVFRSAPAALAPRRPVEAPMPAEDPVRLAEAMRRLLEAPEQVDISHLPRRMLPTRVFVEKLRQLLAERGTFTFDEAVTGLDRMSQAVAFWALLELYKAGEVRIGQAEPFSPIRIARAARTRGEEAVA